MYVELGAVGTDVEPHAGPSGEGDPAGHHFFDQVEFPELVRFDGRVERVRLVAAWCHGERTDGLGRSDRVKVDLFVREPHLCDAHERPIVHRIAHAHQVRRHAVFIVRLRVSAEARAPESGLERL